MIYNTFIKKVKYQHIFLQAGIFLLILSIFFSVRKVFELPESYIFGQFSDFTTISLYLSDIIGISLICLLFYLKYKKKIEYRMSDIYILLIFWLISKLLLFPLKASYISIFFTIKLIFLLFVAYGTDIIFTHLRTIKVKISPIFIRIFLILTSFQAFLAILQHIQQKSLGLYQLGESHIGPNILGTAKVVSNDILTIRSYGTFPHPNVLSVFLVFGLGISIYLLLEANSLRLKILYSLLIILNTIGLTLSFSRAGYLAYLLFISFFTIVLVYKKYKVSKFFLLVLPIILFSVILSYSIFKNEITPRSVTKDPAFSERVFLNKIGLNMIKNNWFLGVGAGESVLHMEHYSDTPLKLWQKQPIHNYFLLSSSELGLPGLILFLFIFANSLIGLIKKLYICFSSYYLLLTALLLVILFLMQFDHYFYTLNQPQLLLWMFLGLVSSETKKSPVGD